MSANAHPHEPRMDRRVRRTRDRLGDALVQLIHEKPFDAITVEEVLARADVSRSTFYEHFRDKQDLLLSDADEFFAWMASRLERDGERSDRLAPVREFFEHVGEMGDFRAALVASGKFDELMRLAHGHFALGIERRLAAHPRGRGVAAESRAALGNALAGAMLSLLSWWLGRGTPEPAAALDATFHALAWGGVDARQRASKQ